MSTLLSQFAPDTVFHIGLSGGKDSTALLLWAIHESGIEWERVRVTFSDTGNEHDWTYWYVRFLARYVRRVTRGKVIVEWIRPEHDFYELARKKKRFPSQVARFCTEQLKIIPTKNHIEKLKEQGFDVIMMSGVRGGETRAVKRQEFEPSCKSIFGVPSWNAIFSWTLADVWAIHRRYSVPPNPLYTPTNSARGIKSVKGKSCIETVIGLRPYRNGAGRVGCYPCVNSTKQEIANVARNFPDRIAMIRHAETTFPVREGGVQTFFHQEKVPKRFHSRVVQLKPLKEKQVKYSDDSLFPGEMGTVTATSGLAVTVPTIDDVVRWALSGGNETEPMDLEMDGLGAQTVCARSGACE